MRGASEKTDEPAKKHSHRPRSARGPRHHCGVQVSLPSQCKVCSPGIRRVAGVHSCPLDAYAKHSAKESQCPAPFPINSNLLRFLDQKLLAIRKYILCCPLYYAFVLCLCLVLGSFIAPQIVWLHRVLSDLGKAREGKRNASKAEDEEEPKRKEAKKRLEEERNA